MFYTHTHNRLYERRECTGLSLLPPMISGKGGLRRSLSPVSGRAD